MSRGVGRDDIQRSLLTSTSLRFCDLIANIVISSCIVGGDAQGFVPELQHVRGTSKLASLNCSVNENDCGIGSAALPLTGFNTNILALLHCIVTSPLTVVTRATKHFTLTIKNCKIPEAVLVYLSAVID